MKNRTIIFFSQVDKFYFRNWEYYVVDNNILNDCYSNVIFTNNTFKAIYLLFKFKNSELYCWWWHRSFPVILPAWLLRKKIYSTGAIHMYDYSKGRTFYSRSFIYRIFTSLSLRLSTYNLFISNDQLLSISSALKVNNPILAQSSLTKSISDNPPVLNDESLSINKSYVKLLFIGWLTKSTIYRKSLITTLEAVAECIFQRDINIQLVIAGRTADGVEMLKQVIKELSISDHVSISLDISQEEKDSLYMSSDLMVSPSYMEGFGNASLEAMSFGCPVVVSRYGASPEVVGDTGFIINSIDSNSIANALSDYHKLTIKERKQMRIEAYTRAYKCFGYKKRLERLRSIFNLSKI
tara:strand:+ start:8732 stop:9787 length:1056 start_codon:yes stop_codon:yes gene_type:complete